LPPPPPQPHGYGSGASAEPVEPGAVAAAAVAAAHVSDLDFVEQRPTFREAAAAPAGCDAGLCGGLTVVEATCHRAANATWSDPTPSPDLLVACGRCLDDPPPSASPLKPVVCVGPGLVSAPVRGLVNGRMTLTQIISFHD
jgi:hypothetical protein